jgi:hypothetical protein
VFPGTRAQEFKGNVDEKYLRNSAYFIKIEYEFEEQKC